ncbi:ImmA/IrrE family metallo-endopeptidase [Baekduia soli]|uniref:ImmA/IrrE family metallo-endopeptidase n=1 Tax=Baekduia soli TaxID=496014 RepID=A0A5B8U3D0_9ACTN|nr:ImmA/IrrE family metallo-endopeptidase [Baekduia soli]QEC47554.1 ImmA/IrrE family metallo-endopeptidase [Baekduia soli]
MSSLDHNRGAKRAREARRALGLDPVGPLPCLLSAVEQAAGLPVVVARLAAGVAGACHRDGDRALLWVNGLEFLPRRRFTLAHELGHAWCRHDGTLAVDTMATLNGGTTSPHEIQANAFAAEFLLPRAAMEELVVDGEPGLDEVVVIAAGFGVSALVVLYRLKQLGLAGARRIEALQAEIAEGLHTDAFARLRLTGPADRLAAIATLPYLSPALAGTHLEAALRGEAAADDALAGAMARLLA